MYINVAKIAKLSCITFLFYVLWFQYAFRESNIILYSTAVLAVGTMALDLILTHSDLLSECPWGVMNNLVLAVYSILTGLISAKDSSALISQLITYVAFTMVTITICYISANEKNSFEWLANIIILIDIIILFFIMVRGYYKLGYGYVLGPNHNPNSLGLAMDIGLFCLAYKTRNKSKRNVIFYLLALFFLYIVIGSGSRKCLIGAAIIIVMWIIPSFRRNWEKSDWKGKLLLLLFVIVAIAIALYYYRFLYMHSHSYVRMQNLGDDDEGSSGGRIRMYQYAFDYFQEHPLFGIGLNQYRVWSPTKGYSHSTYAESLASWGIVGCSIYYFPIVQAGIRLIKLSRDSEYSELRYTIHIVLALYVLELFLGIGQIWFYSIEHMIAWTLIYLTINDLQKDVARPITNMKHVKYFKV